MPRQRIRILLVDDTGFIRQSLAGLISIEPDMEIVGEASDGMEAIELTKRLLPEVVVMDVNMPKMNGIEATRAIHSEFPYVQVIGFSMLEEAVHREAMRQAGAARSISKSGSSEALFSAIRDCHRPGAVKAH
jgi:DNA-binding NarL/FixJ family response regulator